MYYKHKTDCNGYSLSVLVILYVWLVISLVCVRTQILEDLCLFAEYCLIANIRFVLRAFGFD